MDEGGGGVGIVFWIELFLFGGILEWVLFCLDGEGGFIRVELLPSPVSSVFFFFFPRFLCFFPLFLDWLLGMDGYDECSGVSAVGCIIMLMYEYSCFPYLKRKLAQSLILRVSK